MLAGLLYEYLQYKITGDALISLKTECYNHNCNVSRLYMQFYYLFNSPPPQKKKNRRRD